MFSLIQKLGRSILDSAKVYFTLLGIVLGLSSGFVLVLGSVWSRQNEFYPDGDFLFIGGNMMLWTTFISIVLNIPLAVLGSLLLRDKAAPLIRFGFGFSHFVMMILGQVWRSVLGAVLIIVIMYFPFSALMDWLPHEDGSSLVDVNAYGPPSAVGIALAVITLVLPVVTSVLVLASSLLRGGAKRRGTVRRMSPYILWGLCALAGVGVVSLGFGDRQQAGIFFTFGLVLLGVVFASRLVPYMVTGGIRVVANAFGYRPVATLSQSVAFEYRSRFSGISLFIFLIAAIPSLLFTASAIQGEAEGKGGIAQWDFWTLFAAPIVLILLAVISAVLVLSQLLVRSLATFQLTGVSRRHYRLALLTVLAFLVVSAVIAVFLAVGVMTASMTYLWKIDVVTAISQIHWLSGVGVGLAVLIAAPVLYLLTSPEKRVTATA